MSSEDRNRSHLPIPDRAQGGNIGGWALDAKGGKLKYCSEDYGPHGNAFSGRVKVVQIALADAAESFDHLVSPEDAVRIAMARQ